MKYQEFVCEDYTFDVAKKSLVLSYSMDGQLSFSESYSFDFPFASYNAAALDRAVQNLFFMAGVSYYKTYLPPTIIVNKGQLDQSTADFFSKTYGRGLGEFFYVNQLDPRTLIAFPNNVSSLTPLATRLEAGFLAGLGGGKDSLVTIEALQGQKNLATWSVNHRQQLAPLVERVGLPHYQVDRTWDAQLATLNQQDAYNGHVPISAILACVGTIIAILTNRRDVVMSNEQSANEATLTYQGVAINHQYSKSSQFERDYQTLLSDQFGQSPRYYSLLRPYGELRIGELFAGDGWAKYQDVFCSCNRAYVAGSNRMGWCGVCPKCAFAFMQLTPFVDQAQLLALFNGKNLLLDPTLEPTYRQLLGIEGNKPLECVGDVAESRAAMCLCQAQYPQLSSTYQFDIPASYDFRAEGAHNMPPEMYQIVQDLAKN